MNVPSKLSNEEISRQRQQMKEHQNTEASAKLRKREEMSRSQDRNRNKARQASLRRKQKSFISEWGQYIAIAAVAGAILVYMQYSKVDQSSPAVQAEVPVIEDSLISRHNEDDNEYSLGANKLFDGVSVQEAKKLFNNGVAKVSNMPKCSHNSDTTALPNSYNWRNQYPQCEKPVVDQGLCSSSWAIATAGVFTDRFCAQSGDTNYRASTQQLLTCEKKVSQGCERGFILGAMEYGRTKGFISSECMGYKPYDISVDCNYTEINKCPQKEKVSDYCAVEGTEAIKREIMTNGPVAGLFPVYRDFLVYRDGVYQPGSDVSRIDGNQAVKVFGWDSDSKGGYWLIENSFGEEWGQSGVMKVKMGVHDSGLDKLAIAVTPAKEESE